MSSTLNTGVLRVPESVVDKAIEIINTSAFTDVIGTLIHNNFYYHDGTAEYYMAEEYGDIESELRDMTEKLFASGITPDVSIQTFDETDGEYIFEAGELTWIDRDEMAIRGASTEELLAEVKRRNPEKEVVIVDADNRR